MTRSSYRTYEVSLCISCLSFNTNVLQNTLIFSRLRKLPIIPLTESHKYFFQNGYRDLSKVQSSVSKEFPTTVQSLPVVVIKRHTESKKVYGTDCVGKPQL